MNIVFCNAKNTAHNPSEGILHYRLIQIPMSNAYSDELKVVQHVVERLEVDLRRGINDFLLCQGDQLPVLAKETFV